MTYAFFVAALADPHITLLAGLGCLVIVAGALLVAWRSPHRVEPAPMRTADRRRIEEESEAALHRAWDDMSPLKGRVNYETGTCAPQCSPRACDTNATHCARLREGSKVITFQRLSFGEKAAIQLAARIAALEDHTIRAPARPAPMPAHTRAAAMWRLEYQRSSSELEALERALQQ